MRGVALSLALLALLPAGISATLTRSKRRLAGQARFTDTFSLLKKLNSNPYAFNQAFPATPVSLSQGGSKQAGGDVAGFNALLGSTAESATTAGSDAAADAVSDSIKDLFDLDQPAKASNASAPKTPPAAKTPAAPKPKAPPASKPAVAKSPAVAKMPASPAAPKAQAPKAPPAPKPVASKASTVPATKSKQAPPAPVVQPQPAKAPPAPKPSARKATVTNPVAKPKAKAAAVTAPAPKAKVVAVSAPALKHKTTVAKDSVQQSPKPAAKKVVAMQVSKSDEKSAALTREAQLEAELSTLKAKLAQTVTLAPKPVKAAPPPPPQHSAAQKPVAKVAPAKQQVVAKAVVKPAPVVEKAVAKPAPVVKTAQQAKPVVEEALKAKLVVQKASSNLAMASVSSDLAGRSVNSAHAVEETDELEGNFEAPESHDAAAFKPLVKDLVAVVLPASKLEPIKMVAKATPTAAPPAPEELTMTMVPPASAVPKVEQTVLTEPIRGSSFFWSIGHFFHRIFLGADPVIAPVAPTQAPLPDPNADRPAFSKQDIERTWTSAIDDGLSDLSIADDFRRKENEDISLIDRVKREDRALRIDAETPQKPSMPAPSNFQHDKGSTHISNFWGTLEDEDGDIENALTQDGDDLTEYERLRKLQDDKVRSSVSELSGPRGDHLALERRALRKAASAA